jgi:antitoxin PrlF
MVVTSKGQVTIPQRIRNRYGLKPGTTVEFVAEGTKVLLRPAKTARNPVDAWLKHATGAAKGKLTTAQIMKLTRGEDA